MAQKKKYRTNHPDKIKEGQKTYYKKHRERLLAKQNEYYANLSEQDKKKIIECITHWRKEHPEKVKEYRKKRAAKQAEYYEIWYKENGRKRADNYIEISLEWIQEHPDRVKIERQTLYAVNNGKIKRPETCPRCGRKARIQAHHFNYDHYMNFVWLCSSCHKKEHNGKK